MVIVVTVHDHHAGHGGRMVAMVVVVAMHGGHGGYGMVGHGGYGLEMVLQVGHCSHRDHGVADVEVNAVEVLDHRHDYSSRSDATVVAAVVVMVLMNGTVQCWGMWC